MRVNGYRGIWYFNQPQNDEYHFKYSGGFATYPQQIIPLAVYSHEVNRTYFCYGGRNGEHNHLGNMVSYYDHNTGMVPQPKAVLERQTNDAHYNPTLALDHKGHIYVFCNSHGQNYQLTAEDPSYGHAYIYRSTKPHSIDEFTCILDDNFSYSQIWPTSDGGMLWLHSRYLNHERRLFFASSANGLQWKEPRMLAHIESGSYQVSWANDEKVATAFDYHPMSGGLNMRTNLYYLESNDLGATWTTASGQQVQTPICSVANPALVRDYKKEGLLVYLKDIAFTQQGHPVILYLTSQCALSGPQSGERVWHLAQWTGDEWAISDICTSDHNYDHGSLYVEEDNTFRVIAPTQPGAQPFGTGGDIASHISRDGGMTWEMVQHARLDKARNQTYVRKPVDAHPDFYAFWADGDAFTESDSSLYFATKEGQIFELPETMAAESARPELASYKIVSQIDSVSLAEVTV